MVSSFLLSQNYNSGVWLGILIEPGSAAGSWMGVRIGQVNPTGRAVWIWLTRVSTLLKSPFCRAHYTPLHLRAGWRVGCGRGAAKGQNTPPRYLLRLLMQDGHVVLQLVQAHVGILAGRIDWKRCASRTEAAASTPCPVPPPFPRVGCPCWVGRSMTSQWPPTTSIREWI